MYNQLVAIVVNKGKYTIGYLKYGRTNIWADIGSHDSVFESIKRKHLYYLSKYSFYE